MNERECAGESAVLVGCAGLTGDFTKNTTMGEDLRDSLANIMHWSKWAGEDFDAALGMAKVHFLEETTCLQDEADKLVAEGIEQDERLERQTGVRVSSGLEEELKEELVDPLAVAGEHKAIRTMDLTPHYPNLFDQFHNELGIQQAQIVEFVEKNEHWNDDYKLRQLMRSVQMAFVSVRMMLECLGGTKAIEVSIEQLRESVGAMTGALDVAYTNRDRYEDVMTGLTLDGPLSGAD